MSGTTPVGIWNLPLSTGFGVQDPTTYKSSIDACMAVAQRVADNFAPRPLTSPTMNVQLDAGSLSYPRSSGVQVTTEVATQTVAIGAAPTTPNNRIDIVAINANTGVATVIAGTPAVSPVAPAITAGLLQIAQISVPFGTTLIGTANITDLRTVWSQPINNLQWITSAGTVNAITAAYFPVVPTLYDGLILSFRATGANTSTAPTFSPNGLTAHPITKKGGQALELGDIPAALFECLVRYNLANTRWELLNPGSIFPKVGVSNVSGGASLTTGVFVKLTFDTEEFDTNNNFASSTFTCSIPGIYAIAGVFTLTAVITGTLAVAVYKNGVNTKQTTLGAGSNQGIPFNAALQLAVGDTIEAWGFQSSGSTQTEASGALTFMSIVKQP